MMWAWEIGRLAGFILYREADRQTRPVGGIPGFIGMEDFLEKTVRGLDLHIQPEPTDEAKWQYQQQALPERLSTAIGNQVLRYNFKMDELFIRSLTAALWQRTTRRYMLGTTLTQGIQDSGIPFTHIGESQVALRPEIDYRELAASLPLELSDVSRFLEYVK